VKSSDDSRVVEPGDDTAGIANTENPGAGGGIRTHTGGLLRPVPLPLGYAGVSGRAPECAQDRAQTLRSLRSLATWPVARTWYSALSIRPCGSITKVDRITPVTVLPYICFSP
jgi:hypothetical protein